MNEKILNLFLDLALERQTIWYKKEILKEEKPWTSNLTFQKYWFTNVFRDQDKVSQHIIHKIIPELKPDFEKLWRYLIVYRYISKLEIFEDIEKNVKFGDLDELKEYLITRNKRGMRCVTGAYYVRTMVGILPMEYVFLLIEEINNSDFRSRLNLQTIQDLTEFYTQFDCIGGFMAYEYTTDLTYTPWLKEAHDIYTWANLGPGCNKGINIIKGEENIRKNNKKYLDDMKFIFMRWIEKFRDKKYDKLPYQIIERLRNPVMRDIEHWLCEFSKYAKYSTLSTKTSTRGVTFKHRKYPGRL